jgi:two-component system, OmpR family, sensor kinase
VGLPIRTRLTLVFAVLSVVVVGVAAVALVFVFRAALLGAVDERLRTLLAELQDDPRAVRSSGTSEEEFAQYVEPDGSLVAGPGPAERLLAPDVTSAIAELRFFSEDVAVETPEEVVPVRILAAPVGGGVLVVGVDAEDQAEAAGRLLAIVAIGGPLVVVAMAGLGWLLAGAALRPVERLREEASAISSSEPDRRLPVPDTGDELQRLAETLNEMLDRLHEALDSERRFVDEASHELRTPLGILQAEVELARKQARSPDELADALASIDQETDRLCRLTQDLLVLARSDRGRLPVHREDVDVSAVIDRVVNEFGEQAGRAGVRVRGGSGNVHARVDGDRLRQAIENLVDNAIRHAGTGGTVEVVVERDAGRLRVSVTDSGPGFRDAILDRAFEPFARVDGDRAGDGAGLGLTIVRAVAEAHGGSATARNLEAGGAEVSIDVPV